ncbi:DMT family transporter [Rhodoferax sp. TBRC 17198]|uniref:DMT family transporter n=1 Tax=Rhodoferax potami TaxID=3068338 RepID=UPI0028BD3FEB|nr:DMT family transporter [Rhodoferax sp. TBRC 17198]MDT7522252.1 DMT family transporter [Rhodoferax sp. TBRC 17198]
MSFFTRPRNVFLLAGLCCLLWGSAYPAIKQGYALLEISRSDLAAQILFAGYRFVGAGALLLMFAKLTGKDLRLQRAQVGEMAALGVFQTTLQYIFFYIGVANTTGVKASILNTSGVFFSVLLAHFLYHNDTLTWRKMSGCVLGLAGVLVVNAGGLLGDVHPADTGFSWLGEGFVVLAALVLSSASLYGKRLSQRMDSVVMTGYQLGIGGVVLVAIGLGAGGQIVGFTWPASLLLVYMAFLSAVAFALWGVLLKHNRVSTVALYSFLVPVFGAGLSALFLGESLLEWKYLAALVLVSLGIYRVTQEA